MHLQPQHKILSWNVTSQSWKQMFFMWTQVRFKFRLGLYGTIFHRKKVMHMSSAQDFPLGFSAGKAMQHDSTACTCWLPLVACISFKTTLREAEGDEDWMHPCTFANFWNRLLRSAKHLQADQGPAEQVKENMLQMTWEKVWRWKNFRPPQLVSETTLPLTLSQTQLSQI